MPTGDASTSRWPPPVSDLPEGGGGGSSQQEKKKKKKKRRRRSNSADCNRSTTTATAAAAASSGDHVSTATNVAAAHQQHSAAPKRPNDDVAAQARVGAAAASASAARDDKRHSAAAVARVRRDSDDVVGSSVKVVGGVNPSGSTGNLLDQDHGHVAGTDNDNDQDEGVVVQRESLLAPTLTHHRRAAKRKTKQGLPVNGDVDRARGSSTPSPAASIGGSALDNAELAPSHGKKIKAKDREVLEQGGGGGLDEPPLGIPHAFPKQGAFLRPTYRLLKPLPYPYRTAVMLSIGFPGAHAPRAQSLTS